jgi:hypothetical protein
MEIETISAVLDNGSEVVINLNNVAYVLFVPAEVGGKAHAEIHFIGRETPLGVGESVIMHLRKALLSKRPG